MKSTNSSLSPHLLSPKRESREYIQIGRLQLALQTPWREEKEHHLPLCLSERRSGYSTGTRIGSVGAAPWQSRISEESRCMVSFRAKLISQQKTGQCHNSEVFW